jgi:hypothetical protein
MYSQLQDGYDDTSFARIGFRINSVLFIDAFVAHVSWYCFNDEAGKHCEDLQLLRVSFALNNKSKDLTTMTIVDKTYGESQIPSGH